MTRIIGISSGKGGVGKTTIALNLALALKNFGKKVIVVDCNVSTPHIGYYIGAFDYNGTINDVLRGKIDIRNVIHQNNGITFIPASLKLEDLIGIDPIKFKRYINKLRNPDKIDFILIDSAPGLGREAISVLDASDEVVLVTSPHAPMINDLIRCKEIIKELGNKQVKIVVNMINNKSYGIINETIENVIGAKIIGNIPFDKNVELSLVVKEPVLKLKPNSKASIAFMQTAANLIDKDYKPPLKSIIYQFVDIVKGIILPEHPFIPENLEEMIL